MELAQNWQYKTGWTCDAILTLMHHFTKWLKIFDEEEEDVLEERLEPPSYKSDSLSVTECLMWWNSIKWIAKKLS